MNKFSFQSFFYIKFKIVVFIITLLCYFILFIYLILSVIHTINVLKFVDVFLSLINNSLQSNKTIKKSFESRLMYIKNNLQRLQLK